MVLPLFLYYRIKGPLFPGKRSEKCATDRWKKPPKNILKLFAKKRIFRLQFPGVCGIIIKHDCDRYAKKREVAASMAGFSVEYVRF